MKIRRAKDSDIEKIVELYIANWQDTYRGLVSDSYLDGMSGYATRKWTNYCSEKEHVLFVAHDEENFAGFAGCKPEPDTSECFLLDSLHVSSEFRGKGIGTALIKTCLEYAKSDGYKAMSINVVRGNENARGLYMKLGAEHNCYFEDTFGGDEIVHSEKLMWTF